MFVYHKGGKTMPIRVINCQATCANIKKLIEENGLTPKNVKELLDLDSVQSIYKWYATANGKGKSIPSVDHVITLAHILGVSLDTIYGTNEVYCEGFMVRKLTDLLGIKCIPAISTGNLSEDNLANARLYVKLLDEYESRGIYPVLVNKEMDNEWFRLCMGHTKVNYNKEKYQKDVEWTIEQAEFSCFEVWLGRFLYDYRLDCFKDKKEVEEYLEKLVPPVSEEYESIFANAFDKGKYGVFNINEMNYSYAPEFFHFEDLEFVLLPVKNPWEILGWFPFGRFNACPNPNYHIALAKELYQKFGAKIMYVGKDNMTYYLEKPLMTKADIEYASKILMIADGDLYTDYPSTAESIIGSHTWQLWWD